VSLATRCPACLTTFRVVQDQLRVSEGWVRCGRCNEVFNAVDHLVDLTRTAPPPQPAAVTVHASSWPETHAPSEHPAESTPPEPTETDIAIEVSARGAEDAARQLEPEPGRVADAAPVEMQAASAEPSIDPSWAAVEPAAPAAAAEAATPSFLQAAERAQRWQRPAIRRTLLASAVVLVLALFAQASMEYRDLVAARWTSTKPVLDAMRR
jgi:predicted Zn finger-like uncharacterized protein